MPRLSRSLPTRGSLMTENGSGFAMRRWHVSLVFEAMTPTETVLEDDLADLFSLQLKRKVELIHQVKHGSCTVRVCQTLKPNESPFTVLGERKP